MCNNIDNIVNKVSKLLSLANNNSNDAEARSAMLKAQKLMAEYGIEESHLDSSSKEEEVINVSCEHKEDRGYRKPLGAIIAQHFRCKSWVSGKTIMFMGTTTDAAIAKKTFEFAYTYMKRRGEQEYNRVYAEKGNGEGVFNSYVIGFLDGLRSALSEQSVALMIVTPKCVEDKYAEFSKQLGKGSGGIRQSYYHKDVADTGRKDAIDQFGKKKIS